METGHFKCLWVQLLEGQVFLTCWYPGLCSAAPEGGDEYEREPAPTPGMGVSAPSGGGGRGQSLHRWLSMEDCG